MALRLGSVVQSTLLSLWDCCRLLTLRFQELSHVTSVPGILGPVISLDPNFAVNSEWGQVERSAQFVGFLLLNQHPVAHLYLRAAST